MKFVGCDCAPDVVPWSGVIEVSHCTSFTRLNGTHSSSAISWVCAVKQTVTKLTLACVCSDGAVGVDRDPRIEPIVTRSVEAGSDALGSCALPCIETDDQGSGCCEETAS